MIIDWLIGTSIHDDDDDDDGNDDEFLVKAQQNLLLFNDRLPSFLTQFSHAYRQRALALWAAYGGSSLSSSSLATQRISPRF